MRIHSDTLTNRDLANAATIARVSFDKWEDKGSRKRDHAFEVTLTGESRRRPNSGNVGASDAYAATWDQWGVFLAVLFSIDPAMVTPYYKDATEFHYRTRDRFLPRSTREVVDNKIVVTHWPADAHGDHTFRFDGTPFEQSCTKCSAVQRWR